MEETEATPPSLVSLSAFSPCPRRLSTNFTQPSRPVVSSARRMARVSLQGRLLNAEEASSARAIGGSFGSDEVVAWELFSPIERFLIVAVIGVATAESKKNLLLSQLTKSMELRDQVISGMQQKLDSFTDQLKNTREQQGTWGKTNVVESTFSETFGCGSIKFAECGCWICDQHRQQSKGNLVMLSNENEAEQEERRMSDLSDWASTVASAAEVQLNNLAIEQDIFNLKRECEEKDAAIRELSTFVQSSNMASSKRISELEDIIHRKNTTITRLKKDLMVLEQKVVHLTRLQRPSASSSTLSSNCWQIPVMTDNLLYDVDSTTSPSYSDSDCSPKNRSQAPVPELDEVTFQKSDLASNREQKSAPAKVPSSFVRQSEWNSKSRPATPLKEIYTNHKPITPSSRQRRVSANRDPKRIRRQTQSASKDPTTKKRWA